MSEGIPMHSEEERMLSLPPYEFDQGADGWRKLQDRGEFLKAADLIEAYIKANSDRILNPAEGENGIRLWLLRFHQGQVLAMLGEEQRSAAISAFKQSFDEGDECWNAYVSATIGFLEGDKGKIEEAIQTVETSTQEEKRQGNIGIVRNFKKALEEGVTDYEKPYSWPRDES